VALRLDRFAQLAVERLDGIRGVNHAADLGPERQKRRDVLPCVQPGLRDHGEALPPLLVEALELRVGVVSVQGGVDRFEVAGDLLALAPGHVLQAVADQMDDARLHDRLGEDRLDRLREPFEPVDAADQDVLHAALLELREDLHPELRALGLLEPHPQDVAITVHRDPEREVARAALNAAALTDLQHQAVQKHDRVDVIQGPGRPRSRVVHHGVGDATDQITPDLDTVELPQIGLDVACREAPRIQRDDLLVKPLKPALALAHDPRLKAPVTITGRIEVLDDEKATTALGFLRRAIAHYGGYGITVEQLITDNGSAYRSTIHAIACRALGIRHLRTRPYRPQTNGKAERFTRTMLGGWAYGAIYRDSTERNQALAGWIDFYNHRRPHGAISHKPPIARPNELNNLLGTYT